MFQAGFDFSRSHLAGDLGFASGGWHQLRATKIDMGGTSTMVIVDGFRSAGNHGYAEDRHRLARLGGRERFLLRRVRNLRDQGPERQKEQSGFHHSQLLPPVRWSKG